MWVDATRLDYFVRDKLKALLERGNGCRAGEEVAFATHGFLPAFARIGYDRSWVRTAFKGEWCSHWDDSDVDIVTLQEYINNIQVVDGIVKDVETMIKECYHDDRTAFLFT